MISKCFTFHQKLVLAAAVGLAVCCGFDTLQPLHGQEPDPAAQLYVSGIGVTYTNVGGPRRRPVAVVRIVDGDGLPVNDALVVGNWSGCFKQNNDSAITQTFFFTDDLLVVHQFDGEARIWADKVHSCWGAKDPHCHFTFTITGVFRDGMTYVPVNGYGTSWSSIQCQ